MTSHEVAILAGRAQRLGLPWSDAVGRQLAKYQAILLDRGHRTNLVSQGDLGHLVEVHFVDCLRPLPYLPSVPGARVLDLGSGAGLPGIVLYVFRPDIALYLVESSRKKGLFLQHVVEELRLENARVLTTRAETLAETPEIAGSMDTVVSRAVAHLGQVARWSRPLLRPGGWFLTYKPLDPSREIEEAGRHGELGGFSRPEVLSEAPGSWRRGSLVKLVKEPIA